MIHELPVHKGVTENNGKITAPTPTSCPCTCSDIYQVGDVSRKQSMLPSPGPPTLCVFLAAYDASCVCFSKLLLSFTSLLSSSRGLSCSVGRVSTGQSLGLSHYEHRSPRLSAALFCVAQVPGSDFLEHTPPSLYTYFPRLPVFSLHPPLSSLSGLHGTSPCPDASGGQMFIANTGVEYKIPHGITGRLPMTADK